MWSRFALIVVLAALGAGCQSDDPEEAPSATVATTLSPAPTTSTTAAPLSVEQEVEAAYLKSWEVYADALLRLDGTRFPEVYVDDALALRNEELADLTQARTPVRIDVEHDYEIVLAEGEQQALVIDAAVNHSVLLELVTNRPTEPDPNEALALEYQLRREGLEWKVEHARARS